jgi:hypothetical protein
MKDQINASKTNSVLNLPGSEVLKGIVSEARKSHAGKPTQSFHFLQNPSVEKSITVERYQRNYTVVFDFYKDDKEVVLVSIDDNHDIDTTYSEDFIDAMTDEAKASLIKEGSNESYNDQYNGD